MHTQLTPLAALAGNRMIAADADGSLRLIWGDAAFRLPIYDLPHLAAALDDWEQAEDLPSLRRGYYRLCASPDGGLQLWMNNAGLCLSRHDLRLLAELLRQADEQLRQPVLANGSLFSGAYRVLPTSGASYSAN
jgi:hypothetical protein